MGHKIHIYQGGVVLEYACVIWNPAYELHCDRIESIRKQFTFFALRDLYDPLGNLPSYKYRLGLLNLITASSRKALLCAFSLLTLLAVHLVAMFFSEDSFLMTNHGVLDIQQSLNNANTKLSMIITNLLVVLLNF